MHANESPRQAPGVADSEATEDECGWEEEASRSPPDQDSGINTHDTPPPKRKRVSPGRRALQQLLKDPHESATRPLARHDAAFKAALQRGCEGGETRPRRRSVPTPRFGIPHSKTPTLHIERDSAILQLVLEKRPYLIHRQAREKELYGMVVRALKPNGVWAVTLESVQRQIKWLGHVLHDTNHTDHAHLLAAPELKDMVVEYYATSDADLENLLKKMNDEAQETNSGITFDDVLLQEVLVRRPFAEKKTKTRTVNAAWDELAATLNERLGVKVFYSGTSCKHRVARLRTVARGTRPDSQIELTEAQRVILEILENDIGTPATAKRRQSLDLVHAEAAEEEFEPEEIPYLSLATEDEASEDDRIVKRCCRKSPQTLTDNSKMSRALTPWETFTTENNTRPILCSSDSKSNELVSGHEPSSTVKESKEQRPPSFHETIEAKQLKPLSLQRDDGHLAFATERVSLTREVACLQETVHTLQARVQAAEALSATWAQRLDHERQQHHAQMERFMDLLKTEREAQRHETSAMLNAIAAERRAHYQTLV